MNERTISEINPNALVVTEQRSLPVRVVPATRLLFAVATRNFPSMSLDVLVQHPEAVQSVVALAYAHPDLIEVNREPVPSTDLDEIRKSFPNVVNFFENDATQELLAGAPLIQARVAEERQLFSLLPAEVTAGIKDIELVMRILIENGSNRSQTAEDYYAVISAHKLYGDMATRLEDSGEDKFMDSQEITNFYGVVGQRLLRTVRLFETNVEGVDLDYKTRHAVRETDYRGVVAQIATLMRVATALVSTHDNTLAGRIKGLKADIESLNYYLDDKFPERRTERERYAWAEVPGGPDLTKAEMTNSLWGGNG